MRPLTGFTLEPQLTGWETLPVFRTQEAAQRYLDALDKTEWEDKEPDETLPCYPVTIEPHAWRRRGHAMGWTWAPVAFEGEEEWTTISRSHRMIDETCHAVGLKVRWRIDQAHPTFLPVHYPDETVFAR